MLPGLFSDRDRHLFHEKQALVGQYYPACTSNLISHTISQNDQMVAK